jgi:hypothetical protein
MRHPATRWLLLLPFVAALALAVSACSNSSSDSTTTTLPSSTATQSTETFTGTIGQNGSVVHSFGVKTGGYSLLAGITAISPTSVQSLGIGIGAWDANTSTCGLNITQNDSAKAGSTAISGTASAGNYCVRVYDGGNLTADVKVDYTVQVQHY